MSPKQIVSGRSCFLIAPVDADISALARSLSARQTEIVGPNTLAWDTASSLRTAVHECDFVCVYAPRGWSQNIIFELGLAVGLDKRIFMVVGETLAVFFELRTMSYVVANRWNPTVIEPHLDAFLATLSTKRLPKVSKRRHAGSVGPRRDYTAETKWLQEFGQDASPNQLESFVAALFSKASISVTPSPIHDYGADFALLSPAIKRQFKNPILVEIKHGRMQPDMTFAVRKLLQLVGEGRGSAALLVTMKKVPQPLIALALRSQVGAPVLALTVAELIDALSQDALIEKILEAAKRPSAHGE